MKKAIIVEDYKLIADIWKSNLEEEGFEMIRVVHSSDEVENTLLGFDPDIILMDVNLPGKLNGLELSEVLILKDSMLKILILTSHTDSSYVQKALSIGARGFVTKSSPITELKKAINEILAGKVYVCNEVS